MTIGLIIIIRGFSTIAGAILSAYISLGVPAQNLITESAMSIPASIAISKLRVPEVEEPVTRGRVIVDRGKEDSKRAPVNALHAFDKGAVLSFVLVGQILCNLVATMSLVVAIDSLLTQLDWPRVRYPPSVSAARSTIRLLSYNVLPRYVHAQSLSLPGLV